jgi:tetratricopeptide (TPR) repeat protein
MKRTSLALGALVALAGAAALAFGGLLGESASAPRPLAPVGVAATELLQGFSPGDTADYVAALERRVAADRDDAEGRTLLGLAYLQRARETGDAGFYPRAEEALRQALALAPRDHRTLTGLASLAASRHDFLAALRLARRALAFAPSFAAAHGIRGDALAELGRYREAFAAFDRMATLKPTLASYARVAYARELLGRGRAAAEALGLAVEAGAGAPEHEAWALVQLGNLELGTGRVQAAARAYRAALARVPGYPSAEVGLARVAAARGRFDEAVERLRAVVARVPLPEYAVRLSEVLRAAGREKEAREADTLVATLARLLAANGVRTELETALFDLDRGRRLGDALARAREAFGRAPSVQAEDVLAWALFKNGHCGEARAHSVRALRLGTRDALMHFHRGMIERCLGNRAAARAFLARALAIDPHFSPLHAPVAREALR